MTILATDLLDTPEHPPPFSDYFCPNFELFNKMKFGLYYHLKIDIILLRAVTGKHLTGGVEGWRVAAVQPSSTTFWTIFKDVGMSNPIKF